jgi:hypothetical protein
MVSKTLEGIFFFFFMLNHSDITRHPRVQICQSPFLQTLLVWLIWSQMNKVHLQYPH